MEEKVRKVKAQPTVAKEEVQPETGRKEVRPQKEESFFEPITGTVVQVADYLNKLKKANKYPFLVLGVCVSHKTEEDDAILDVLITRKP